MPIYIPFHNNRLCTHRRRNPGRVCSRLLISSAPTCRYWSVTLASCSPRAYLVTCFISTPCGRGSDCCFLIANCSAPLLMVPKFRICTWPYSEMFYSMTAQRVYAPTRTTLTSVVSTPVVNSARVVASPVFNGLSPLSLMCRVRYLHGSGSSPCRANGMTCSGRRCGMLLVVMCSSHITPILR